MLSAPETYYLIHFWYRGSIWQIRNEEKQVENLKILLTFGVGYLTSRVLQITEMRTLTNLLTLRPENRFQRLFFTRLSQTCEI
jgi:hypothetical protein